MAEKAIKSNEIIQDGLFDPTVQSGKELKDILDSLKIAFSELSKESQKTFATAKGLNSAQDINKVTEALEKQKNVREQVATFEVKMNKLNEERAKIERDLVVNSENLTKAYEEILGTFEQNVIAVNNQRRELKRLNAEFKIGRVSASEFETKSRQLKESISQTNLVLRRQIKTQQLAEGSAQKLSIQLDMTRMAYREMNEAERESAKGQEMLAYIQKLDAELKRFDGTLGVHNRHVGNYQLAYKGLETELRKNQGAINTLSNGLVKLRIITPEAAASVGSLVSGVGSLRAIIVLLRSGLIKLFATLLTNPFGILLAAVTALGVGIVSFINKTKKAEEALEALNKQIKEFKEARADREAKIFADSWDKLISRIEKSSDNQEKINSVMLKLGEYVLPLINDKTYSLNLELSQLERKLADVESQMKKQGETKELIDQWQKLTEEIEKQKQSLSIYNGVADRFTDKKKESQNAIKEMKKEIESEIKLLKEQVKQIELLNSKLDNSTIEKNKKEYENLNRQLQEAIKYRKELEKRGFKEWDYEMEKNSEHISFLKSQMSSINTSLVSSEIALSKIKKYEALLKDLNDLLNPKAEKREILSFEREYLEANARLIENEHERLKRQEVLRYKFLIEDLKAKKKAAELENKDVRYYNDLLKELEKEHVKKLEEINLDFEKRKREAIKKEHEFLKSLNDIIVEQQRKYDEAEIIRLETQLVKIGDETLESYKKIQDEILKMKIQMLEKERDLILKSGKRLTPEQELQVAKLNLEIAKLNALAGKKETETKLEEMERFYDNAKRLYDEYLQIQADARRRAFDLETQERDRQIKIQSDRAAAGLQNQLAFEEAEQRKAAQKRREEEAKEARRRENLALAETFINALNTNLKDPKMTAGQATAKALGTVFAARGIAKSLQFFSEGSEYVDLKGASGKKDDIPAMLMKGEGVVTKEANAAYSGVVGAMNKGIFHELYAPKNVAKSTSENFMSSIILNEQVKTNRLLEKIAAKPSQHIDVDTFGQIVETIYRKSAIEKTTYKTSIKAFK